MMKERTIYALGFFDGVHLGHGALLRACRELADRFGCKAGAVTFINHPDALVQGKQPALINTPADRKYLLETQFHMDHVVELPFDRQLRSMAWEDFLKMLREDHGGCGFVCGEDFRFGYKGSGNAALLRDYCREAELPCAVIPEQKLAQITVSSTHIRKLLEAGRVEEAGEFLGHPHILSGTVVPGKQLGRTIGVPTANLTLPEELVAVPFGVYACRVRIGEAVYAAVTNIGTRPTVSGVGVTVEPWILDFSGDLYGQRITLEFHKFLRPERKFSSLEELQTEIRKNAEETREFFKNK